MTKAILQDDEKEEDPSRVREVLYVVAGARFELATFGL